MNAPLSAPLIESRLPLTAAQLGIWLGQQLDMDNPLYWTAEAVELHGAYDIVRLQRAIAAVLNDTEILHMRIAHDESGMPYQYRVNEVFDHVIPTLDFSEHADPRQAAWQWMQAERLCQLPDDGQPLYATTLLILGTQNCVWYLRTHHVIMDGYAYSLLLNRVADAYEANGIKSMQCASLTDIVQEDQRYQVSDGCRDSRDFWLAQLRTADHEAGTVRPLAPLSHTVIHAEVILDATDKGAIIQAAQKLGLDWVSYIIGLYAAWQMDLLGREEVRLGLPIMARLGSVSVATPCMRMNMVPLILKRPEHGSSWFDTVKQSIKAMRPHQNYRYEAMREDVRSASLSSAFRLFGSVVNIMPFEKRSQWADLRAAYHVLNAGPVEDLSMNVIPKHGGLSFEWHANSNAYSVDELHALADHMGAMIRLHAGMVCDNSSHGNNQQSTHQCTDAEMLFAWLSDQLRSLRQPFGLDGSCHQSQSLRPAIIRTEPMYAVDTLNFEQDDVLARIAQQAKIRPDHIAVSEAGGDAWTYAQLWLAVQTHASALQHAGVMPNQRVMLILPRRLATVASILAVLYVGASYIPLDPNTPILRVQQILEDEGTDIVILPSDTPLYGQLKSVPTSARIVPWQTCPDFQSEALSLASVDDWTQRPAYTIYTSGSTGRPNGVMISRASLAHFVHSANQSYQITAQDRVLQFAPLHFDASVEELFMSLCHGATLILRNDAMLDSMTAFTDACVRLRISVLDLPTAFWHEWVYGAEQLNHQAHDLRLVIVGGEAVLAEKLKYWQTQMGRSVRLLNSYGPTETTIICTLADLSAYDTALHNGSIPVGQPLAGLHAIILDEQQRALMLAASQTDEGELCICGPMVGLGYWQRDEVMAKRFIATRDEWLMNVSLAVDNPLYATTYRTGDRVRLGDDGQLYYLGRLDDELKISGHRIDPREVENALLTHPQVQQAAVIGLDLNDGSKHLTAFCVLHDAVETEPMLASFDLTFEWKKHLSRLLVEPAIPQLFYVLPQLPLNANNKIDRKALANWAHTDLQAHVSTMTNSTNPQSQLQSVVQHIWSEVLGLPSIGSHQNFFEIGGKSLQAIQVANRLRQKLQQNLSISALFRYPTIAQLSAYLAQDLACHPPENSDMFAPVLCLHSAESGGIRIENAPNLFCLHPAEGLAWCYMGLAKQFPDFNIYGLQNPLINQNIIDESSIELLDQSEWIERYAKAILTVQKGGVYHLLGWSSGGGMAHAVACRLQDLGCEVQNLVILDSYPSSTWQHAPEPTMLDAWQALLDVTGDSSYLQQLDELSIEQIQTLLQSPCSPFAGLSLKQCSALSHRALQQMQLYRTLQHPKFNGDALFFQALSIPADAPMHPQVSDWQHYIDGEISTYGIQSTHASMCRPLPLAQIGEKLAQYLHTRNTHKP